jgi:2-dehydro-3-deoxygluconokinase
VTARAARVACIGECMIEVVDRGDGTARLGFGGDVLNTAAYLVRSARQHACAGPRVEFVTVTGDDAYSRQMRALWRLHGVRDDHAMALPGELPGLYLVRRDASGERTFSHYRSASAARRLFGPDQPAAVDDALASSDVLYLSAITLSIISADARRRLTALLDVVRARGGRVMFDSNYRASGWDSPRQAREVIAAILPHVDVALPTLADDQQVFGDADAAACVRRLRAAGVREVVVKVGARGCLVVGEGEDEAVLVPAEKNVTVIDTTAAGDAFNGAYIAARLGGAPPPAAAVAGNSLAAQVIGFPGALLPAPDDPEIVHRSLDIEVIN